MAGQRRKFQILHSAYLLSKNTTTSMSYQISMSVIPGLPREHYKRKSKQEQCLEKFLSTKDECELFLGGTHFLATVGLQECRPSYCSVVVLLQSLKQKLI